MTIVRLAYGGPPEAIVKGLSDEARRPALLVSYYYLRKWQNERAPLQYRDWVMDSGAFSADNSGKVIDLGEYIACCKKLLAEDPRLTEVFALDVIGDWRAGLANTERMWAEGIPALPTFHVGEPWDALLHMANTYPKIAIGGVVGCSQKFKVGFLEQCFARVWPKKIHGLGMNGEQLLLQFPFHSCDASNWEIAPCAFGSWRRFGKMSVRGGKQNLRSEVEYYLRMEQLLKHRWRREMALLETL